jgi:hypothetical protein
MTDVKESHLETAIVALAFVVFFALCNSLMLLLA